MKAVCPNDPTHDRFITSAHIAQEWEVDEEGNFIDVYTECTDVTHKPESGNTWQCKMCLDNGVTAEATVR